MRRFPRKDKNHAQIVAEFQRHGCGVLDLSPMGGGCPDILVSWSGLTMLCEIKDGAKPPSARKLTPDQVKFWNDWRASPKIVKDESDVVDTVETLQRWSEAIRRAV